MRIRGSERWRPTRRGWLRSRLSRKLRQRYTATGNHAPLARTTCAADPRFAHADRAGGHRRRQPGDRRPAGGARRLADPAGSRRPLLGPGHDRLGWAAGPTSSVRPPPPGRWPWRPFSGRGGTKSPAATPAGVACTASLATDRPKRGPHRVHVALQTAALTAAWWLQLQKDRRSRAEEERLVGRLLSERRGRGVRRRRAAAARSARRRTGRSSRAPPRPPAWQDLLLGKVENRLHRPRPRPPNRRHALGAFNPLHAGHRRMVEVGREILQAAGGR